MQQYQSLSTALAFMACQCSVSDGKRQAPYSNGNLGISGSEGRGEKSGRARPAGFPPSLLTSLPLLHFFLFLRRRVFGFSPGFEFYWASRRAVEIERLIARNLISRTGGSNA